jgi:hypothetical protein
MLETDRNEQPLRIAMWSGPRNISTAMMRAFENRGDCAVADEPLYGAWLKYTGASHPMADEVIAAMETDWRKVVRELTGPVPRNLPIWYQKHMTHHQLPDMLEREWLSKLVHVFLIRPPEAVVASYLDMRGEVSAEDIGIPQQQALFDFVHELTGAHPPVIDSGDFLHDPRGHLEALCDWLGIEFSERMLNWPPGPRESDGVWAPHWYESVWRSTGFAKPRERIIQLDSRARRVADQCRPIYEQLRQWRLQV